MRWRIPPDDHRSIEILHIKYRYTLERALLQVKNLGLDASQCAQLALTASGNPMSADRRRGPNKTSKTPASFSDMWVQIRLEGESPQDRMGIVHQGRRGKVSSAAERTSRLYQCAHDDDPIVSNLVFFLNPCVRTKGRLVKANLCILQIIYINHQRIPR